MTAWKLAYHANCWGPLGGDAVGVTSINRLAYRTFGDMAQAARDIAAAGYDGIEFFDGNVVESEGDDYAAMRRSSPTPACRWSRSMPAATSSSRTSLTKNWRASRRPRTQRRRSAPSTWWLAAGRVATTGRAKATTSPGFGARQGHGNRRKRPESPLSPPPFHIVENPDEVSRIFGKTGIGFCPDTAHLAAAGGDVAAMVREHASRISYIHLKGWQRDPFAFGRSGRGDCDNGAVIQALKDIGYTGWICNELDAWADPVEGARESHAFVEAEAARN